MAVETPIKKRVQSHYIVLAVYGAILGLLFLGTVTSIVLGSIAIHRLRNLEDYYDVCKSEGWTPTLSSADLSTVSVTYGNYRICGSTVDARASLVATTVGGANNVTVALPYGKANFVLGMPTIGYCSTIDGLTSLTLKDASTAECTVVGAGANETVGMFLTYEKA